MIAPHDVILHYSLITPDFLKERRLRGLLLDLDNTLVPYGDEEEHPELQRWINELQQHDIRLYLLSNATPQRAARWARYLGIQGVGLAGKPNPYAFRRAAEQLQIQPSELGMLGDQLFTDVLGARWAGMYAILVRPLSDNALPHTRLVRKIERILLRRYGW